MLCVDNKQHKMYIIDMTRRWSPMVAAARGETTMTQDEMEQMLQALGQVAIEQQAFNRQQQEFNRQQVQLNDRMVTAIERLEITLQAIKDMLERGGGH
jgi:hypothetical protein